VAELLAILFWLVLFVVAVTVVGHGFWVLLANLFGRRQGGLPGERSSPGRLTACPRCHKEIAPSERWCVVCGIRLDGEMAAELVDLEATIRQLERLEDAGLLSQVMAGQLRSVVQIRRQRLERKKPQREAAPESAPIPTALRAEPSGPPAHRETPLPALPVAEGPREVPAWKRLEEILLSSADVKQLTSSQRVQVLLLFARIPAMSLAEMVPWAQLNLARLLRQVGRDTDALEAYRRLLATHLDYPEGAKDALEAGRFAVEPPQSNLAAWFLEQALARSPGPEVRREAEELLASIRVSEPVAPRGEAVLEATLAEAQQKAEPAAPVPEPPRSPWVPLRPRAEESPAEARPPRRSLGEVLAAFMEERNILWGELVGGLLIVGCSIALVISLWKTLEDIPYFPFLIVAGITTALFGAGLYTLHHWKLESTSRGLLAIATLLVPLNFWVMAGLVRPGADDPAALLINGATLLLFAWLLCLAARVFAPEGRWLLPLAVLGASVSQLLAPHFLKAPAPLGWFVFLAGLPVGFFGLGVGGVLLKTVRSQPLEAVKARALLAFLGIASFALLAALGFLVFFIVSDDQDVSLALHRLAVLIAAAGIPVLACGILVHRGLEANGSTTAEAGAVEGAAEPTGASPAALPGETLASPAASLAALRTGGTMVLLAGMLVMLAGVALAWPQPGAVLLVCGLNFAVLTLAAFHQRLPLVHTAAIPCLVIGYLVGCSWLGGELVDVPDPLLSVRLLENMVFGLGGLRLVALAGFLALAAEGSARRNRRDHAAYYAIGGATVALLSWLQVTGNGMANPERAALVSAIYAAGTLAMNLRWRRSLVSYCGLGLAVAATLWDLQAQRPLVGPVGQSLDGFHYATHLAAWGAALALEALALVALAAAMMRGRRLTEGPAELGAPVYLAQPLCRVSEAVAWMAALAGACAGWLLPWQVEYVVTGTALVIQYVLLVGLSPNLRLARIAGWLLIGTVVATAGWAGTLAETSNLVGLIGLCVAATSTAMATVSVWATRPGAIAESSPPVGSPRPTWFGVLAAAWRETSAAAALIGLALSLLTPYWDSGLLTASLAALAATAFLLAWRYQAVALTLAGSALAACSLAHGFVWNALGLEMADRFLVALLTHGTIGMLAAGSFPGANWKINTTARRVLFLPLLSSVVFTSMLALPLLLNAGPGRMVLLAGCAAWWAAILLALAWLQRSADWFSAFQAALALAVSYATTAWLEGQLWLANNYPQGLTDPRSLQSYGLALAGFCLAWLAVRIALRSRATGFLQTAKPAVDRVILATFIVGQAALAVWGIVPGVLRELTPQGWAPALDVWPDSYAHTFGWRAWLLLGMTGLAAAVNLWQRRTPAILGLAVIALTIPVLAAGLFEASLAAASALGWGLATTFVVASIFLWLRRPLDRWADRMRMGPSTARSPGPVIRWLLLGAALVPVLALTTAGTLIRLLGNQPAGPAVDSIFAMIGDPASTISPLILLAVGLVGHALLERSPGFAFAAGLLANVALMVGYALGMVRPSGGLSAIDGVRLLQWGSVGAATWAVIWLLSRRWVNAWRPGRRRPLARPLMEAQIGLGLAMLGGLVVAALRSLLLVFPDLPWNFPEAKYFPAPTWVPEVGSWLGWLALGLVVVARALQNYPRRIALRPHAIRFACLAALALLACSLEKTGNGNGYRIFMVGCAAGVLAFGLEPWRPLRLASVVPGTRWVGVGGCLVLLLTLKAAIWHHDFLWAAAAIALASLAGAAVGVRQRREDWAFVSGQGLNLSVSLIVWHLHRVQLLQWWWPLLVQVNIIANAAGTLFWLWIRRRMTEAPDQRRTAGPFLATQVTLGVLASAALLVVPLCWIFLEPQTWDGGPPAAGLLSLSEFGSVWGWLALLLAAAATAGYLRQAAAASGLHLAAGLALAFGVLAACTVSRWDSGDWLTYHALTTAWTAAGLAILLPRLVAARRGWNPGAVSIIQSWIVGIGAAVVVFAVRGAWDDPGQPYWSAGATLAVSGLMAALALWLAYPRYVYASGLLVNLAGIMTWLAWGPDTLGSWVATNVLCLGITSVVWSVVGLQGHFRATLRERGGLYFPFSQVAALVGQGALILLAGERVLANLAGASPHPVDTLAWASLLALVAALIVLRWDAEAEFTFAGLYAAGLVGGAFALDLGGWTMARYLWTAALVLAGYVLATALLSALVPRMKRLGEWLHLPRLTPSWPEPWFPRAQTTVGLVTAALSLWMSAAFEPTADRLAGPLAAAALFLAGILLANTTPLPWGRHLRLATLLAAILALIEAGWALLDRDLIAPWLNREVVLMVVLAAMTFVYGVGLPRVLNGAPLWVESARKLGPALGLSAALVLMFVLGHEAWLYDAATGTIPLPLPGIIAVGLGLAVLIGTAICFAVLPGYDPLAMSERGRTLYVYAGEGLLALLFVHLRFSVPELFFGPGSHYALGAGPQGYWSIIVMVLAFLGVGLSEYLARKGLHVLAEPLQRTGLFLPLLPLVAFWFQAPLAGMGGIEAGKPGDVGFRSYAFFWFASGTLYAVVAVLRRSFWFGLVGALAVNFGLWSMLYHYGWRFLVHPQMWLIPLALIALVAEHVNRGRLSRAQSTGLRYLALGMLYLSSTADMFITGVGNSLLLPLVLAVLSVLGVLAGIVLRVRAFLFLGVAFLFLVVFAQIWHAAVDRTQTWVWWASGIALGVAIVALFAVFEKRRNDVLRLIEEIKKWD
jgi:hypothetical protein